MTECPYRPSRNRGLTRCDRCGREGVLWLVTCHLGCEHPQCVDCAPQTEREATQGIRDEDARWAESLRVAQEVEQAKLDNHYGYCTLSPDHSGPCGGAADNSQRVSS